jgi:hypothetical protein
MLKHSSRVGAVVVRSFGLGVLALAVLVGLRATGSCGSGIIRRGISCRW